MNKNTIYDVTKKLIGPINPIGESNEDDRRFENLQSLCYLVDKLMFDISDLLYHKNTIEYSKKRSGLKALDFLKETKSAIEDDLEG